MFVIDAIRERMINVVNERDEEEARCFDELFVTCCESLLIIISEALKKSSQFNASLRTLLKLNLFSHIK
jgi:hypothetical protein